MCTSAGGWTAGLLFVVLCVSGGAAHSWWQEHVEPLRFGIYEDVIQFPRVLNTSDGVDSAVLQRFRLLSSDHNSVLVGARNAVYNVSLLDLSENVEERVFWRSADDATLMCQQKGLAEDDCHNYMRVVRRHGNGTIFVCGTYAYNPQCHSFKQKSSGGGYQPVGSRTSGVGVCPYSPHHNSSFVVADGEMYSATAASLTGADPLVYRRPLRTVQAELLQLNDPHFVGSFDHGGYVYFFFRETAVEYINCGKRVYSRVARVCKNDRGASVRSTHWTSFMKARLNCSVPGDYPFYFDEIQSISLVKTDAFSGGDGHMEDVVYAIFTTPVNSIAGSAVCAFRMSDVEETFTGAVKHQDNFHSNWLPLNPSQNVEMGHCSANSRALPDETVRFISSHPLLDRAVPAVSSAPLLLRTSSAYRLTQLSVQPRAHIIQVEDSNRRSRRSNSVYDVVYASTDNGRILKAVVSGHWQVAGRPLLLEEMLLPPMSANSWSHQDNSLSSSLQHHQRRREYVTSLLVVPGAGRLLVVSDARLLSLPLAHCSRAPSVSRSSHALLGGGNSWCARCVKLQDPHCGWHEARGRCVFVAPSSGRRPNYVPLVQNVSGGVHMACGSGGTQMNVIYQEVTDSSVLWNDPKTDNAASKTDNTLETQEPAYSGGDSGGGVVVAASVGGAAKSSHADAQYSGSSLAAAVSVACVVCLLLGFGGGWLASRCALPRRGSQPPSTANTPPHAHNHSCSCHHRIWRVLCGGRSSARGCCPTSSASSSSSAAVLTSGSSATKHLELQAKLKHLDEQNHRHQYMFCSGDLCKTDNRYDFGQPRNDSSMTSSTVGAKQINLLVNATKPVDTSLSPSVHPSCTAGGGLSGTLSTSSSLVSSTSAGAGSPASMMSSSAGLAPLEKNVNSTFDNLPVQKVRKMYL